MKGVPVRVEIGPKDIEKNQCVVVRRDTREKAFVSIDELVPFVENLMVTIHNDMYDRALKNTQEKTFTATRYGSQCMCHLRRILLPQKNSCRGRWWRYSL